MSQRGPARMSECESPDASAPFHPMQPGTDASLTLGDMSAGSGLPAPAVDAPTARALRAATDPHADALADADLAALVRSATRPGLQARILAYRDGLRAAR